MQVGSVRPRPRGGRRQARHSTRALGWSLDDRGRVPVSPPDRPGAESCGQKKTTDSSERRDPCGPIVPDPTSEGLCTPAHTVSLPSDWTSKGCVTRVRWTRMEPKGNQQRVGLRTRPPRLRDHSSFSRRSKTSSRCGVRLVGTAGGCPGSSVADTYVTNAPSRSGSQCPRTRQTNISRDRLWLWTLKIKTTVSST